RKKFPDAKIDYLVKQKYRIVLDKNPYLDELVTFKEGKGWRYVPERIKLIMRIRERNYDLIIDQIRGFGSAQMAWFSGAKFRLGFKHKKYAFLYNLKAERQSVRYHSSMKFDALLPLGITEEPHKLYFNIEPESEEYIDNWLKQSGFDEERIIIFSPGSPVARKKWNLNAYARLGEMILQNLNCKIVILWAPNEKEDADALFELMNQKPLMAPATDLNQAAAMLKRSALLICNDGGLNHLSVATETPSIAIFGSIKPYRWSPEMFEGHYHFFNEQHDSLKDDSFGIDPDKVYQKVLEILE
ncbi:MAG: glycosyltransferase family 9 protein, partial [Calditrichaceae bacterium]|nr:glycosyltransferase family 9 protein [Calditrichaceae bacterium]